jgi:hypothetical protein
MKNEKLEMKKEHRISNIEYRMFNVEVKRQRQKGNETQGPSSPGHR